MADLTLSAGYGLIGGRNSAGQSAVIGGIGRGHLKLRVQSGVRRVVFATTLLAFLGVGLGAANAFAVEGKININTARAGEIEKLPFIGKAKALAIIRYREHNGPFESMDELRSVPELGDSAFYAIKPYLVLSDSTMAAITREAESKIVTQPGQVRLLTDRDYFPVLERMIGQAELSIDMVMFLFKITDSSKNRAALLVEDLIKARKRGVMVTVLLEKSGYDPDINRANQRVAARLKRQGVNVRFDSEKATTHAKAVVIDRRYTLIGSHNFTGSALSKNHEASLLVDNQALASQLVNYMRGIR